MTRSALPLLAAILLLAGCAVGPDYRRPDLGAEVPGTWSAHRDTTAVTAWDPAVAEAGRWWTAFGDATLDSLVDTALRRNNDLQAAASRVVQARALARGAGSERWPTVEVGGSASRSKSANLNFPSFISPYLSSFSASATARYEADLWGRVARGDEAAVANLLAGEYDRAALARAIVAEVVNGYAAVGELGGRVALTRRTVSTYEQTLHSVQERYDRGLASSADLELARQNLLAARAALSPLRQQLGAARRRLEVLCGAYPEGAVATGGEITLDSGRLPPVPGGLPSTLLDRRPDLRAAELRLHAAVAQVGQAKAALYPRISLTAGTGFTSRDLADLGKSGTDVWSLVGNLVMPLINRGATKSQYEAARARAAEAASQYRATVLTAFAEVENALELDSLLARQVADLAAAAQAAEAAADLSRQRYRDGLDNLLMMLEAERRALNTAGQLLTARRQRVAARVDLIVALGGPWDDSGGPTAYPSSEPQAQQGATP